MYYISTPLHLKVNVNIIVFNYISIFADLDLTYKNRMSHFIKYEGLGDIFNVLV